jgi:hypothetical protein
MDYTEAFNRLDAIVTGKLPDTEAALSDAISVYRSLGSQVKEFEALQARAKQIITEIMQETGQTKAVMPAGTAQFTADSVRVSYDTKALDALCASSPNLAEVLAPHRKEMTVKGSLTIK